MAMSYLRLLGTTAVWAFILWDLYRKIQFYFFPPGQTLSRYRRKPQAWAVITGASAGIGYAFAQELIATGFGVILIARSKERLDAATQKLQSESPDAAVKTIVYNAQNADGEELAKTLKPVMDLPITVLVNNVGGVNARPAFGPLSDFPPTDVIGTINMNTTFMAQLTRIMIPILNMNGPSLVIGMSSAGEIGGPWIVLYSACKAFVRSFSAALARESRAERWKIDSLGIVAGEVYSEFNTEGLGPGSPTARQYAKIVMDRVELAVDREMWVISPHWAHALQQYMLGKLPERLLQKMMSTAIGAQRDIHARKD